MAKRIETNDNGSVAWSTRECEDYIVIDSYLKIKRFIPSTEHRLMSFEERWLTDGTMLRDTSLIALNSQLKRQGFPTLSFINGHSDSYSVTNGSEKAMRRQAIKEEIEALTPQQRSRLLEYRRAEAARIQPRDGLQDAEKAAARQEPAPALMNDQMASQLRKIGPRILEGTALSRPVPPEPSASTANSNDARRGYRRLYWNPLYVYVVCNVNMKRHGSGTELKNYCGMQGVSVTNMLKRLQEREPEVTEIAKDHDRYLEEAIEAVKRHSLAFHRELTAKKRAIEEARAAAASLAAVANPAPPEPPVMIPEDEAVIVEPAAVEVTPPTTTALTMIANEPREAEEDHMDEVKDALEKTRKELREVRADLAELKALMLRLAA